MSVQTEKKNSKVANRDAFLCFCHELTPDEFRAHVAAEPDAPFEKICAQTGVGTKCTACLLNAEKLFVDTVVSRSKSVGKVGGRKRNLSFDRRAFYAMIDGISPLVARRIPGIIPVFAGPGIRTVLFISNSIPPVIGSKAPPFEVTVLCRDGGAKPYHKSRHVVEPGANLEVVISDDFPVSGAALETGSCFLHYRATRKGFIGGIRPHFKVETPASVSAVHSAGAGHRNVFVETCLENRDESQYISAINCEKRPVDVRVWVERGGKELASQDVRLEPMTSHLIKVPLEVEPGGKSARPLLVRATSNGEVRWHYGIVCGEPPRIALDHI